MGIARGAHGAEWGESLHRGGALTPGATKRLMAAYPTWRGIPPPRSPRPLVQRAQQPHVPPPQPGRYGNAAVASMMARGTRLDSSSYSSRRTATITTLPPLSGATTATRATNVRARTWAATSSTSPSPSNSAPPTAVATPHQQRATDATWTAGDPAPSRAGTPQSPRQERASKLVAQREPTQHHKATGIRGHRASPAGSGAIPSPTNAAAVGTQPEQPPGTAHPHRERAPSPTGGPQPLTPPVASAHGPRPAASQAAATQAQPEPRPHHGPPDRPAVSPAYAPPEAPPTQAHTATPTDTTTARPSDTMQPHFPGPTEGLIPQAPATSGAEDLPATTHNGPVPQRHHAPPTGPTARPAEPSSPGRPATGPRPGPGTHRRPGGRPTARGPREPTRPADAMCPILARTTSPPRQGGTLVCPARYRHTTGIHHVPLPAPTARNMGALQTLPISPRGKPPGHVDTGEHHSAPHRIGPGHATGK